MSKADARASAVLVVAALRRLGLAEAKETPRVTPLPGGVSSEIWRVDLRRGAVCVKRPLAQLRVAQDWRAPVERMDYEVAWLRVAAGIVPGSVPALLGQDAEAGLFVMAFLDPHRFRNWKAALLAGRADPATAVAVMERLVRIHAGTAGRADIARAFASDAIFHAIRLAPYLAAAAERHPDRAAPLTALIATTAETRRALVHGDVSPKNILIGPAGPVFLDAECAWYGDPAFDLAFCLNHLLLKCLARPAAAQHFLAAFTAAAEAYLAGVSWESAATLEGRAARLLPGLLLARIDGKSPVEYVTAAADRERVRCVARALLAAPVETLAQLRDAWSRELADV